jgi:conjugal transfer pilin signal peptidase TrbI
MSTPYPEPHRFNERDLLIADRSLNAAMVFLVFYAAMTWFQHRFVIGHDGQSELCLSGNHRWYLIDRTQKNLDLGDFVAFRSGPSQAPEIPVGTLMVKRIDGLPGDHIQVEPRGIRIEEILYAVPYPHRGTLGDRAIPIGTDILLSEDEIWVMGDHPRSFDSRDYGPIPESHIVGKAYALPF